MMQEQLRLSFIEDRIASESSQPILEVGRRAPVMLSFSRISEALETALLSTSAAEVARGKLVDVKPAWANGAKVLVEGIQADDLHEALRSCLCSSKLLLYQDDVEDLLTELKNTVPFKIRKLKGQGVAAVVPENLSTLTDFSDDFGSVADASVASSQQDEEVTATVHNTFWIMCSTESNGKTVLSAPF